MKTSIAIQIEPNMPNDQEAIRVVDAVIDYIKNLGKVSRMSARKLWEPVLEKDISLATLRKKYGVQDNPGFLNPILGEADDPARQCRNLVRLDLSSGRNTIIYGSAGSGKVMASVML